LAWHLFATTVVRAEQGRSPVTDMDHYRTRVLRLIAEQSIEAGHGIGVLGVLQRLCGAVALTFADVAVTTLLDGQANATTDALPTASDAIDGRAELFQAQGMVMVQLGLGLAEALARIRAYAYAENRHLSEVASDIVLRRLQLDPDHEQPAP
jgi:AmiR/NasT family two-component response regulator